VSRFPHYLKPNKGGETPQNAIWFDTETRQYPTVEGEVEHRLWFGWACFSRTYAPGLWTEPEWFRFETPLEFWTWVLSKCRKKIRLYLFAHNLLFDARVVETFRFCREMGFSLSRSVIDSPPTILVWSREGCTIEMLDTLNWWRVPLASLGERVGLPKLPMPDESATAETWDTYCRRDVEVLERTLREWWGFLVSHDLGGFARTLAGQAFRTYRHRFMPCKIFIDANEKSLATARASYYGGRTECFFIGRLEEPVRVYDVNSMYPAVMRENVFPAVHLCHLRRPSLRELERWVSEFCVCARVTLATDEPVYPLRTKDKLIFPTGRFQTWLSTPEIAFALARGHVIDADDVAVYERAPLFSGFIDELYQRRLEATHRNDEAARYMLKILMNSLYGKFGQRGKLWAREGEAEDEGFKVWKELDYETGHIYSWRQYGGVLERLSEEPEGLESFPALAAHVTAYARMFLWRSICGAGFDNVLYADTDSLYVTARAWTALERASDKERLGAWKLERESPWVRIHGPKDYEMEGTRKTKGVKKNARWLDESTVQQEQWDSLRSALRGSENRSPRTKTVVKHLRRVYEKGVVLPSGRVLPFRLPLA